MQYVGMDVSSKSFVVHALDEKKRLLKREEIEPTKSALKKLCGELGSEPKLVVFEAGNQMKWIADTLKKQPGVALHVVHPNEVKWIAESGGKKTDKVDAKKLAELARGDLLPRKVHLVEGTTREMRELVSARTKLMHQRVNLVNTLRGYIKQEGVRLSEKFFAQDDWREQLGAKKLSATLKAIIEAFRPAIDALKESEVELVERLKKLSDERTDLLETIPSIGVLASRTVVSALDDAKRFDNRKCVANYGALAPTVFQTGNETHLGRINRDGRQEVRRVMLQCAHIVVRMKSPASRPLREFFLRLEKRSGKKKAVVALARKLLTVCYGVLKSGKAFDPSKVEAKPPRPKAPKAPGLQPQKNGARTLTYVLKTVA
jgi:transposase